MKARGPEWWALYAATFARRFENHVESHGFDAADERRSCHAEHAAAVADAGLKGFEEALASGTVERRKWRAEKKP